MLSQPQETLELQHKQAKPIAVTCFTFPYNDVNNFVLGSEEGIVYSGNISYFVRTYGNVLFAILMCERCSLQTRK